MKSFVNLIGDFANMNRTPDYKAKNPQSTTNTDPSLPGGARITNRRHSLNLTVGVSVSFMVFNLNYT
ncbi:unnamed protein product [Anisakis simplex]|uniref:Uncharacterized protein n=1 Tax=Anisakis simplex TaxID=6269 RepID=A0A0M3JZ98_ANISI|nr:unnamed protein product [Anisakis simplex]